MLFSSWSRWAMGSAPSWCWLLATDPPTRLWRAYRYTCMRFFCSRFLHLSNTYRSNNKASEFFRFCSLIRRLIQIFLHSALTQLTRSLIPCQLSQRQVRPHINWVNAEWDSTSTESTQNDKIFINIGVFCVDSVDVEFHSALTQCKGDNQAKAGTHNQLWHL